MQRTCRYYEASHPFSYPMSNFYRHLYPQVHDWDNLWLAWRKARKDKRELACPALGLVLQCSRRARPPSPAQPSHARR